MARDLIIHNRVGETFVLVQAHDVVRLHVGARDFVDEIAEHDAVGPEVRQLLEQGQLGILNQARDGDIQERLAQVLASGELVAVRIHKRAARMDAPRSGRLQDDAPGSGRPLVPRDARPTWISVELVHEAGARLAGAALKVVTPLGTLRSEVLDSASRWRADDIEGAGYCEVSLVARLTHTGSSTTRAVTLDKQDVWLGPNTGASVRLQTERHHRVVVVGGATTVRLVDLKSTPVASKRCRVVAGDREVTGLTDSDGTFIAHHPANVKVCEIDFPNDATLLRAQ